jgi:phosphate transport system protein
MLVNMSIDIEDKVFELLVRYQPVASDLRMLKSYMKIGYDLERYGRYAWDISFIHKRLVNSKKCIHYQAMEKLSETVLKMVHTSILALKTHDAPLAQTLANDEKEVDDMYFDYLDLVTTVSNSTESLITNLLVVRYLERIADHATYMGESITYIATGEKVILR